MVAFPEELHACEGIHFQVFKGIHTTGKSQVPVLSHRYCGKSTGSLVCRYFIGGAIGFRHKIGDRKFLESRGTVDRRQAVVSLFLVVKAQ